MDKAIAWKLFVDVIMLQRSFSNEASVHTYLAKINIFSTYIW